MAKKTVLTLLFFTIFKLCAEQQELLNPLQRPFIYAPFREKYVGKSVEKNQSTTVDTTEAGCVFCKQIQANLDRKHFILTRFKHNIVFLNLYPYQRGHLLVIPRAHVPNLMLLSEAAQNELMKIMAAIPQIFEDVLGAQGTNIGINFGFVAGASKPDHLHIHALARYENEPKGYLELLGGTQVVYWDLNTLYDTLKPAFDELKRQICD